jgi:hypothetical protein
MPFAGLLGVRGGVEDRLGETGEVDAVRGLSQAEAGGVAANGHGAGVVFRAIEDFDLAVAYDGGGVEGVQGLPVDGGGAEGVGKDA